MAFRLLIISGPHRVEYGRFRAALDRLPANRLPDLVILTTGGPGVPALASCYAAERGLALTTVPIDSTRRSDTEAEEFRATKLAGMADAAVLVGEPADCRRLLDAAEVRNLRVVRVEIREARAKRAGDDEGKPEPVLKAPPPAGVGLPD
ncbi:SLOG family protein [Gemmata sp.]|uniref:SLOG family protein n=1 Tax=Gemmata sp. TaxID=1914242 RepID=UPI003F6F36D7